MQKQRQLVLILVLLAGTGLVAMAAGASFWMPVRRMECTVVERRVLPEGASPFPAVSQEDWNWGPEDARVTLIEYVDLQSSHSAQLGEALVRLRAAYPEDVRLVYRHFPMETLHDKALLAAQALEAAGAQGQFWPLHDRLVETHRLWNEASPESFRLYLSELAGELGLDTAAFEAGLDSQAITASLRQAYDQVIRTGLTRTPTLLINGQYYEGPLDEWTLAAYIELILLEDRQFSECPPLEVDSRKAYTATLQTTQGEIVIRLLPEQAPLAVNSFLFLAGQGWYDGAPFHRVIP
jgi:predicted DsbA family dithiol-disulfide isomerase